MRYTICVPFHRLLLQDSIYFFSLKCLLFTFTGSVSVIPFTAFSSCHHLHFLVFHRLVFRLSEIVFPVSYFTGRLHVFILLIDSILSVEMLLLFYSLTTFSLFHRLLFILIILVEGISVLTFCLFKMHAQSFLINITWPHNFLNKMHWNSFLFRTFFYSTQFLYLEIIIFM